MADVKGTKRASVTVSVFLFFLLILFCMPSTGISAEQPIVLRVTIGYALTHPVSIVLDKWCKDLEKRSNGKVKAKFYPAATLAPAVQQFDAVTKGIADVGNHVLGYTMGRFPLSEVLDLPLGIPNGVVATKMLNEYYKKFQPKELDMVKVLWLHAGGPGYICTKQREIHKIEDLRGLKIRTFGGNARFVAALGGTPVAMPMGDVYDALSRGVVDGQTSQYETLESRRTGELTNFVVEDRLSSYTAGTAIVMNKKVWNSLPADIKKVVDQMSVEYADESGKEWDQADASGRNFVLKRGAKIVALSKEEEHKWVERGANPIFADYVKRMKEQGLPGEAALKFVTEYLKAYQK